MGSRQPIPMASIQRRAPLPPVPPMTSASSPTRRGFAHEPAPDIGYYSPGLTSTRPRAGSLMDTQIDAGTGAVGHDALVVGPPRTEDRSAVSTREVIVVENGQVTHVVQDQVADGPAQFGWLEGVFCRCLLNIMGVVMFLRIGWTVGNAGLGWGFAIILLCSLIAFVTAQSLSAICTNGEDNDGGAYVHISRAVGPLVGGIIGFLMYLANCAALAMYLIGLSEYILAESDSVVIDSSGKWDIRVLAVLMVVILFIFAFLGVAREWTVRLQIVLLVLTAAAFVSFMVGTGDDVDPSIGFVGYNQTNLETNLKANDGIGFFDLCKIFSIFFPAATGFMAGIDYASNLRDAHRDIPVGMLSAVAFSSLTYLVFAVIIAAVVIRGSTDIPDIGLLHDHLITYRVSILRPVMTVGILASGLTSAHLSLFRASRVLKAISEDELLPGSGLFMLGFGPSNEPIPAYIITFFISTGLMLGVGEFDLLAPVTTSLFLFVYTLINYGCFSASSSKAVGWRPSFRLYHPMLAMLFTVICFAAMVLSNWIFALGTIVVVILGAVLVVSKSPGMLNWGAPSEASGYTTTLNQMLKFTRSQREHVKTFRSSFLVLTGDPEERQSLLSFASFLNSSGGAMFLGWIVPGPYDEMKKHYGAHRAAGQEYLRQAEIPAFFDVILSESFRDGARQLLQLTGLGPLAPNVLMMGWKSDFQSDVPEASEEYVGVIQDALDFDKGVAIVREGTRASGGSTTGTVDIWWYIDDGGLTLLLAYLMSQHAEFKGTSGIRLFALANEGESLADAQERVSTMLVKFRIVAEVVTYHIAMPSQQAVNIYAQQYGDDSQNIELSLRYIRLSELIHSRSQDTTAVFVSLPLAHPSLNSDLYLSWLDFMTYGLPPTIIVRGNNQNVLTYLV